MGDIEVNSNAFSGEGSGSTDLRSVLKCVIVSIIWNKDCVDSTTYNYLELAYNLTVESTLSSLASNQALNNSSTLLYVVEPKLSSFQTLDSLIQCYFNLYNSWCQQVKSLRPN